MVSKTIQGSGYIMVTHLCRCINFTSPIFAPGMSLSGKFCWEGLFSAGSLKKLTLNNAKSMHLKIFNISGSNLTIVCVEYEMEVTNECFAAWEKLTNLEIKVRFCILCGPYVILHEIYSCYIHFRGVNLKLMQMTKIFHPSIILKSASMQKTHGRISF